MDSSFPQMLVAIHNIFRWFVLIGLVLTLFKIGFAFYSKKTFGKSEKLFHLLTMTLMDIQFLIGLVLYATSPIIRVMFSDFKNSMKVKEIRFFGIEHLFSMLLAITIIHAANVFSKKEIDPELKVKKMFYFYLGIILIVLSGIPWFRPLFPGL